MTTRNAPHESFFQRRPSTALSDVDSEYLQFKEEFERKEQEYRQRIHTLKKEVTFVKDSITKREAGMSDSRSRIDSRDTLYQHLDEEQRAKVQLNDVKISLLMERVDKAKALQMQLLKGPVKKVNRECDAILGEIIKAKSRYEQMDGEAEANKAKLERYYDVQAFDFIGSDLISRDLCAIDSILLAKDRTRRALRVESNLLFVGRPATKRLLDKKGHDIQEHLLSLETQRDVYVEQMASGTEFKLSRTGSAPP